MSNLIEIWMLPIEGAECPEVEHLSHYGDALPILSGHDEWRKSPERFGLRRSASRNSWHEVALHKICSGLGVSGLEFVIEDHFTCLPIAEFREALDALDTVLDSVSGGIPPLGAHESPDVEFLREPGNRNAYRDASPSYDREYDDSAESFYSFVISMKEAVRYSIDNHKCLLFMRGLP